LGIDPDEPGPSDCPAGASCFDLAGVVHTSSPANPVRRILIPVPPGSYRRVHLRLDIKHGGWDANHRDGRHPLFWLVSNKNLNMYGNGDFYGPNANYLDLQHGIGLVHEDKIHLIQSFAAQPGATYHFDYVYDVDARFVELVVTQGGAQAARVRGVPNVNQIAITAGDQTILDLGYDAIDPLAPKTNGWVFTNLEVDFEK
jgi:hypothetical protein